jgi:hypothetical protein
MIEILLLSASLLSLAGSGVMLWKANNAQQAATQAVGLAQSAQTEAEKFAAKSERAATASRANSIASAAQSKRAETFADKASDSAARAADSSNLFSALVAKMESGIPRQARSRNEAHEQVTAENAAREDKQAIAEAQARSRRPTWLAPKS